MRTKSQAVILAAFLLLGAFSAVPAAAEPRGLGLSGLWAQIVNFFTNAWGEAGCIADPNGGCKATGGPSHDLDAGCGLDPEGGCAAGLNQADAGCCIDPDGGCGR